MSKSSAFALMLAMAACMDHPVFGQKTYRINGANHKMNKAKKKRLKMQKESKKRNRK